MRCPVVLFPGVLKTKVAVYIIRNTTHNVLLVCPPSPPRPPSALPAGLGLTVTLSTEPAAEIEGEEAVKDADRVVSSVE